MIKVKIYAFNNKRRPEMIRAPFSESASGFNIPEERRYSHSLEVFCTRFCLTALAV